MNSPTVILERVWVVLPSHPIAQGLPPYFEVPQSEMYGEPFDIPAPDELLFLSWFSGGEVFRSGCTFRRGRGRIFFFGPGHETFPIYHDPHVRRVIANGIPLGQAGAYGWPRLDELASRGATFRLGSPDNTGQAFAIWMMFSQFAMTPQGGCADCAGEGAKLAQAN